MVFNYIVISIQFNAFYIELEKIILYSRSYSNLFSNPPQIKI